eukprot:TRINITY_DN5817_c0_g2_i1.p1 TRINITY_DN5817_c0_g2~~TRINITY_DN5817_c0_g2_i1.p1  ORF type:complete len:627 (+),score=166.78 TRINITY_DN5817_c0_g2_i1:60-1883(+)
MAMPLTPGVQPRTKSHGSSHGKGGVERRRAGGSSSGKSASFAGTAASASFASSFPPLSTEARGLAAGAESAAMLSTLQVLPSPCRAGALVGGVWTDPVPYPPKAEAKATSKAAQQPSSRRGSKRKAARKQQRSHPSCSPSPVMDASSTPSTMSQLEERTQAQSEEEDFEFQRAYIYAQPLKVQPLAHRPRRIPGGPPIVIDISCPEELWSEEVNELLAYNSPSSCLRGKPIVNGVVVEEAREEDGRHATAQETVDAALLRAARLQKKEVQAQIDAVLEECRRERAAESKLSGLSASASSSSVAVVEDEALLERASSAIGSALERRRREKEDAESSPVTTSGAAAAAAAAAQAAQAAALVHPTAAAGDEVPDDMLTAKIKRAAEAARERRAAEAAAAESEKQDEVDMQARIRQAAQDAWKRREDEEQTVRQAWWPEELARQGISTETTPQQCTTSWTLATAPIGQQALSGSALPFQPSQQACWGERAASAPGPAADEQGYRLVILPVEDGRQQQQGHHHHMHQQQQQPQQQVQQRLQQPRRQPQVQVHHGLQTAPLCHPGGQQQLAHCLPQMDCQAAGMPLTLSTTPFIQQAGYALATSPHTLSWGGC